MKGGSSYEATPVRAGRPHYNNAATTIPFVATTSRRDGDFRHRREPRTTTIVSCPL